MCCTGFIAGTGAHITGYKLAGVLLATELQQRGLGAAFPVQLGKMNSSLSNRALAELPVTKRTVAALHVLAASSSHTAIFLCLHGEISNRSLSHTKFRKFSQY